MFIVFFMMLTAFTGMMFYFGYIAVRNFCRLISGQYDQVEQQPAIIDNRQYYVMIDGVLADCEGSFKHTASSKRSIDAIECLTGM